MTLADAVRRQFMPGACPGRVGAEVELIAVTDDRSPRPADPALLAAEFDAGFVAAARPTFEPGGQLELSPPPRSTVAALIDDVERLVDRAARIAMKRGIRLEASGTNPYHSCADVPLCARTPRYLAMQRLFDTVGPHGRRMMRLTASLQVAVELLPGRAGHEQWQVANLAGPALTAAFANSPHLDGRRVAFDSARTHIWHGVDLRRTGYDGRHLDPADPVGAYTAFATRAERLPIAAAADPQYHLNTLFPPVRPRRGYLEVRYLDAQPIERIGEAIATVDALVNDPTARRDALDLLLPHAGDMERAWLAAATGSAPHADDVLAIARAGMARRLTAHDLSTVGGA
ncbi:glutamate-cysteine ligase family protein [Jiangella gansuensis]|uniref:glutamate-cysteine ligase family protein n=1 Tax=Jiangella gansuensis TaxID=281473 RepID=UPI0004AE351A|nr:glutamate-cysteine ligase family protein [Jiangella gansuensis]